jgi:uncharacterized protein
MAPPTRPPLTFSQVGVLGACYLAILAVSVKLGYLVGLLLLAAALALNWRVVTGLLRRYLWDQWALLNAEAQLARPRSEPAPAPRPAPGGRSGRRRPGAQALRGPAPAPPEGTTVDWRPLVVLLVSAVILTLLEYWGSRAVYYEQAPKFFPYADGYAFRELGVAAFGTKYQRLGEYVFWSGFRVAAFFVLPALVVVLMPGERLRDYGLSTVGFFRHLWIYGVLFLIVLPAVIAVSFTTAFANHYPFYKPWQSPFFPRPVEWSDLIAWELMYAAQFFSLEFFFRGFMLQALKRSMGAYAIFVMVVPYCMIHFGKPMPETLGAIAAGLALGTLALRTGSIWAGFLIHVSVAWTMDLLALLQTGRLPH